MSLPKYTEIPPAEAEGAYERVEISAADLLAELRGRGPDRLWTNYDGELVWTKRCQPDGFTDCCPADEPCARHALMAAATKGTA